VEKNGLYGFIDKMGKVVVPIQYENIGNFSSYNSYWAKVQRNGRYGFIDRQGREIVPAQYDRIYSFGTKGTNWALVQRNQLYGFIDRSGQEIIPVRYDNISYFNRNDNNWSMVERNGKFGFIDKTGKEVVPPALTSFRNDQLMELASFFDSRGRHIDKMGPVKNFLVSPFVGDYAVIKSKKTSLLGVIDQQYKVIVPIEHEKIMIDERGNIHVW
ncbi:unnamed protein product, partial [Symbiodinium microadriaticum]